MYNNEKTKKGDARIVYTDPEAQGDNAEMAAKMNEQVSCLPGTGWKARN